MHEPSSDRDEIRGHLYILIRVQHALLSARDENHPPLTGADLMKATLVCLIVFVASTWFPSEGLGLGGVVREYFGWSFWSEFRRKLSASR